MPYIDKVFSLSFGECTVHSEDAATSLKKQFFPLPREVECLVSGKKSDVIKKPDCDIAKDKLEVESEELDCTEVNHSSSDNHPAKLSEADTTFMEFVVTEGLGLEPEAKKNIVGVVMAQYSNKLTQIEDRMPKLGELLKEEEMALLEKKKKLDDLEEEVAFLKKEVLAKEKCVEELREQSEALCKEEKMVKRKVSHCLEMQQQLENNVSVKKVRSG